MSNIMELILVIPVLLLSLSIHEYSHGYVSYLLGDPTPKQNGRLTLNPIAHLDLVGSLVLLITRRIGWAKPVPIDPRYYKNPRKGLMIVGFAGPGSNLILAIIFALIFRTVMAFASINSVGAIGTQVSNLQYVILRFLILAVIVNLSLGFFNLLPIPPLDGSNILRGLIPRNLDKYLNKLQGPIGMVLLLVLAYTGILWGMISPFVNFFLGILI
ncbi:MAG TPA: site-2 protease family protein [Halanaerobiales bacterium]|nr:site-2 protease family protein [Halanaerobiales bacterium]